MKILKCFLASLLLVSMLARLSAEEESEGQDLRPMVCIEKDKIHNRTNERTANFSALIDRLNHELVQCGIYRVIDIQNLADVLKDNEKFAVAADDGGNKTAIKTPGFFIRLTISNYGISSEASKDAIYGQTTTNETATIELILTLVDMRTGLTVHSANISRSAVAAITKNPADRYARKAGRAGRSSNYQEQALQNACQYVCQDIIKELIKKTPFYVMDVNGYEVMIDAPAAAAPAGAMFDIFKTGKAIRNRRTGKITRRETKICTIKITAPGEDSSTGQVVQLFSKEPVKVDYIARPVAVPPPAAPATAAPMPAVPSAANPF